jgi:hypothetical protein
VPGTELEGGVPVAVEAQVIDRDALPGLDRELRGLEVVVDDRAAVAALSVDDELVRAGRRRGSALDRLEVGGEGLEVRGPVPLLFLTRATRSPPGPSTTSARAWRRD